MNATKIASIYSNYAMFFSLEFQSGPQYYEVKHDVKEKVPDVKKDGRPFSENYQTNIGFKNSYHRKILN